MASGRVGGTKSKISGSVGSLTYKIVPNGDGTYTQIVGEKKQVYTQTKTARLAVQQMCTAQVESMMRDLKVVLGYAFQSAANKSKSLNAFSTFNLMLLAQDCKQHWTGGGDFYYPQKNHFEEVAGPYMLSSGTLPYNCYHSIGCPIDYDLLDDGFIPETNFQNYNGVGAYFKTKSSDVTIRDFMSTNRLTYTSQIFVVGCMQIFTTDPETEETTEEIHWHYAIITLNPQISMNMQLTQQSMSDLFFVQGDWNPRIIYLPKNRGVFIGALEYDPVQENQLQAMGAFSIDYYQGRKLTKSAKIQPAPRIEWPIVSGLTPARALWSWMGETGSGDYPYPW